MKKLTKYALLLAAMGLGFVFASCKADVETEYVTKEVDKKADESAPASVTNLNATAKDNRVLLTWTDAFDSDIYGYEVSYSGTNAINRVVLPALNSTSMIVPQGAGGTYVSGLTNGTEYTFIVKTVDTSGNKSEGVTVKATPVEQAAGETLKITLAASVPNKNKLGQDYSGNKSNTKVTVTANITTASTVKKVVWKKYGSLIAKTLLADTAANAASVSDDNAKWTFDITATDETANGNYTVAAIDEAGREEAEWISIDNFDFTAPRKVKVTNAVYSSDSSAIILNWKEPGDSDYDHVDISFTSNNGTADSEPSTVESVTKGTANKTYSGIDGAKAYYTYTFASYDELGNKGVDYIYKVYVNTTNNIPEGFVEVPGTTIKGDETWIPVSKVFVSGRSLTIGDLYVSDHEVTQSEYEKYCKYGSSTYVSLYAPSDEYGLGDNYPAYNVSWCDAVVYCNLRSMDEGLTPVYSLGDETDPSKWSGIVSTTTGDVTKYCGPSSTDTTWNGMTFDATANGYRLPTEAEWEYIARGAGNSTTTYSGSNTIGEVAWYRENSNNKGSDDPDYGTHEVKSDKVSGTDSANDLDIYDMSGNVREWCWDWYKSVKSDTGASGASSGSYRVIRGGSWNNDAYYCEVADRTSGGPDLRGNGTGFRLVRNAN